MKLATFTIKSTGRKTIGVYQNDRYLDVVALDSSIPNSMLQVLDGGAPVLEKIRAVANAAEGSQHTFSAEDVEL